MGTTLAGISLPIAEEVTMTFEEWKRAVYRSLMSQGRLKRNKPLDESAMQKAFDDGESPVFFAKRDPLPYLADPQAGRGSSPASKSKVPVCPMCGGNDCAMLTKPKPNGARSAFMSLAAGALATAAIQEWITGGPSLLFALFGMAALSVALALPRTAQGGQACCRDCKTSFEV